MKITALKRKLLLIVLYAISFSSLLSQTQIVDSYAGWGFSGGGSDWNYHYAPASKISTSSKLLAKLSIPIKGNEYVMTGDVDGDGSLEIVTVQSDTLYIINGDGYIDLRKYVGIYGFTRCWVSMIDDADGDLNPDVGVGYYPGNGNSMIYTSRIYNSNGTMLKELKRTSSADGYGMHPIKIIEGDVITISNAGYSGNPRGFSRWDYKTATEIWHFDVGPSYNRYSLADSDGDGDIEMLWSNSTVHNGQTGNGTSDGDCYTIIIDEDGNSEFIERYSETSTSDGSLWSKFVRLGSDNSYRILQAKNHYARYYHGISQLHIRTVDGIVTNTIAGQADANWYTSVCDVDGDGIKNVIASNRSGENYIQYILDNNLNVLYQSTEEGLLRATNDLTGNGYIETILINYDTLKILDNQLNILSETIFPENINDVSISDIDDNGINDILVKADKFYSFEFEALKPNNRQLTHAKTTVKVKTQVGLAPEFTHKQLNTRSSASKSGKGHVKVGLILDSSGSMVDSDPNDVRKTAAEAIIDFLSDDDDVFIVDFDESASFLNQGQTKVGTSNNLKSYIQQIDSRGGTDIGIGLDRMKEALINSGLDFGSTGVVLLTDGQGSYNNQAEWYRQQGIPVYTVSYKEFADASLMNNIASLTDGVYVTANNEEDVIQAFSQFYYGVIGNSTIYREVVTTAGSYSSKPFYIDLTATEMIVYLSNLDIEPGLISIKKPGGDVLKLSDAEDVVKGDDYIFARLQITTPGNHTIDIDQTFSGNQAGYKPNLPSNGGSSEPVFNGYASGSYVLEVSTDTKLELDVDVAEKKNGIFQVNFAGDASEINLDNASVKMEVTSPSGNVKNFESKSKDGSISFIPIEGEGNYKIDATFKSSDTEGNPLERHFLRSIVVGEFTPSYIGIVDFVSGSEIQTSQGVDAQNKIGINVKVFKKGSDMKYPIASGRVTNVGNTACTIYLNVVYENVEVGDVVILEMMEWQADF